MNFTRNGTGKYNGETFFFWCSELIHVFLWAVPNHLAVKLVAPGSLVWFDVMKQACRGSSATPFPGFSFFLSREWTLVTADHVAPKIWVLTNFYREGGEVRYTVAAFSQITEKPAAISCELLCNKRFYKQAFPHHTRTLDLEEVHVSSTQVAYC